MCVCPGKLIGLPADQQNGFKREMGQMAIGDGKCKGLQIRRDVYKNLDSSLNV